MSLRRIGPQTQPNQIRMGQNTVTGLSQALLAWLRPLSNIISRTLFQLSIKTEHEESVM